MKINRQILILLIVFSINNNYLSAGFYIQTLMLDSISDNLFDTTYYLFPEKNASFNKGTFNDFFIYVEKNLDYPKYEKENKIEGKVFIQFGVTCHGDIGFVKVVHSSGNINLDNEALRVVNNSPKWEPAMEKGKYVGEILIIPINFKL